MEIFCSSVFISRTRCVYNATSSNLLGVKSLSPKITLISNKHTWATRQTKRIHSKAATSVLSCNWFRVVPIAVPTRSGNYAVNTLWFNVYEFQYIFYLKKNGPSFYLHVILFDRERYIVYSQLPNHSR